MTLQDIVKVKFKVTSREYLMAPTTFNEISFHENAF